MNTTPSDSTADFSDMLAQLATLPSQMMAQKRNTILDSLFYDVKNLSTVEYDWLLTERNVEGSILVVLPSDEGEALGIEKYPDHQALCDAPGPLLRRFAIAGVGSSDIGAAAFARTVANRYNEPVGAIVAGYGVDDVLSEAWGGWYVFGNANRLLKHIHDASWWQSPKFPPLPGLPAPAFDTPQAALNCATDTSTLLRLLLDPKRNIRSLAGHSKGCLSIAYALELLTLTRRKTAIRKAQNIRVTTVGAVVEAPLGYDNFGQYLGAIDWFGAINSRLEVAHTKIPGAWHHLNTSAPAHLDFASLLRLEPD